MSDETPEGKELEALLDRFLVRRDAGYLRRPANSKTVRSWVERSVLQSDVIGNEPLGKGPLVELATSFSREGDRDVRATAVALTLLDRGRPLASIG